MKTPTEIRESIERELLSWPGVSVGEHRFGGRAFRVGNRELGHLHGGEVADIPLPRALRDELVARGRVSPHHHLPDSGWISFCLRDEDDVPFALALFRRNYERLQAAAARRHSSTSTTEPQPDTEHEYDH